MLQKFLIKNLIQNTIHLGHKKNLRNQKNNTLLLGFRNNTDIINLNQTIINFLKIIPLLKTILLQNKTILIITNKQKRILNLKKKQNLHILYKYWLPGNLTNFKHLKKLKKIKFQLKLFPKIIFLLTYQKSHAIAKETNLIKIPLITINDSNSKPIFTTFPIPGNDNSIIAENFYFSIIQHTIFLTYIEKLKKFNSYTISKNLKKKSKTLKLKTLFKIRQYYIFFKNLKKNKLLTIKNKNLKNILYLKKKYFFKKQILHLKKNDKNLHKNKYKFKYLNKFKTKFNKLYNKQLKKQKNIKYKHKRKYYYYYIPIYKSKKHLKKKNKYIKNYKKFLLKNINIYYKKNYTLPRLDSNQ